MKKSTYTVLLVLVFTAGLLLLLYPTVSNFINVSNAVKSVENYNEKISETDKKQSEEFFREAEEYNENLSLKVIPANYYSKLDITGDGMMGYISIPKIGVVLPVYHGTDKKTLSFAAGHIEGTSFPVGGESTHSVITGHRGLPSAKLFTDLDELENGDRFSVTVLDKTVTYEVDRILVVKPEEVSYLEIEKGEDYMTLVTCTPYGINTHRLLVRGKRVNDGAAEVSLDAMKIDLTDVLLTVGLPLLAVAVVLTVVLKKRSKKNEKGKGC